MVKLFSHFVKLIKFYKPKDRPRAVVKVTPLSQKVLGSTRPPCMQGKGLPRLFLPPDPTHVGATSTGSVLFNKTL